jgi:Na+-transporting NADH:ubiquinone oxidoreductase subunit C
MKGSLYTLGFAAVLGTVCALLLTAVASFTAPYQLANAGGEQIRNVLVALGVPFQADASAGQILEIFERNVHEQSYGGVTGYVYSPPQAAGQIQAIALRFSGAGLWGPIEGFLALEPDMRTIRGITFYQQQETPGLGGQIDSPEFRSRFTGKSITDSNGKAGIIIGGRTPAENQVDAITGATMTCRKLEEMLNAVIKKIVKEEGKDAQ